MSHDERRVDFKTAELVNNAIKFLREGARPTDVIRFMRRNLVPESVQVRVLTNVAKVRDLYARPTDPSSWQLAG